MSDVEKLKEFFKKADTDNNGYLTKKELGTMVRKNFGDVKAEDILEMFAGTDLDGDGKVYLDEFIEALTRKPASEMSPQELKAAFKKLDTSGDGFLDVKEVKSILEKAGRKWSDEGVQKVIRDLDKDGDGRINYSEFVDLLKS